MENDQSFQNGQGVTTGQQAPQFVQQAQQPMQQPQFAPQQPVQPAQQPTPQPVYQQPVQQPVYQQPAQQVQPVYQQPVQQPVQQQYAPAQPVAQSPRLVNGKNCAYCGTLNVADAVQRSGCCLLRKMRFDACGGTSCDAGAAGRGHGLQPRRDARHLRVVL